MSRSEDLIEKYLTGQMTDLERISFENQIEKDQALRKIILDYQEIDTILDEQDWEVTNPESGGKRLKEYKSHLQSEKSQELANTLKSVEKQYFNRSQLLLANIKPLYGIAAASILCLIIAGAIFLLNQSVSNDELYVAYQDLNELPSFTDRGGNSNLSAAERLFREKKYEEALVLFEKYQLDNPGFSNPQLDLYIGAAQLHLNKDNEAIVTYKKLLEGNSLDASKAHWYLALTHLKMNNQEKAITELQNLVDSPSQFNKQKAQELLEQLH